MKKKHDYRSRLTWNGQHADSSSAGDNDRLSPLGNGAARNVTDAQRLETISEIDSAEWDVLASDDSLASHRWLTLVEEQSQPPTRSLYFVVRDGRKIVGAAACQATYDVAESTSLDQMLYGKFAPLAHLAGLGATPALTVGSRFGISEPFLLDQSLSPGQREEVANELVRGILAESRQAGATVIVRNTTAVSPVGSLLDARFQSSPEMPTTYLDIRWPTFAAFRFHLKKIHFATESAMRQQNNRASRGGLVIERISEASRIPEDVYGLLDKHYRRLNGVPLPFVEGFLERALDGAGDQALLIVARDGSKTLGAIFGLRHGGCSRCMLIGIDSEKGRDLAAYFVLLNDAIARSIEAGDRRLYYGRLLYDVKLRRGCSLAHSTMWIRGRSPFQRALLRSFIRMRTRKIERDMREYVEMAESNAAAFDRLRR